MAKPGRPKKQPEKIVVDEAVVVAALNPSPSHSTLQIESARLLTTVRDPSGNTLTWNLECKHNTMTIVDQCLHVIGTKQTILVPLSNVSSMVVKD